jgi:glycolate oxidase iron-sulfur subunit
MDGARALREQHRPVGYRWLRRARLNLLTRPAGLRLLAALGITYRWLRLPVRVVQRAACRWPSIRVLDPLARSLRWPRKPTEAVLRYPAPAANSATAFASMGAAEINIDGAAPALFRGCVAQLTEQPLEAAALRLLARLGFPAEVPAGQVCCGAIHRHNGYPADANQQLAKNANVFAGRPVVGLASACVAELREHGELQAIEICRFLLDRPWPADASPRPLRATVAVHEPCSHRNQLRDQAAVYELLGRIPELSIVSLPGNETCCGAAGTYLTEHPEIALSLAAPKIDTLRRLRPDFLVTTNTGCALHLAACARSAGLEIQVLHPIQLVELQLSNQTPSTGTHL